MEKVYKEALKWGITTDRFWDMSLRDVLDEIEAAGKRNQLRQQEFLESLRAQAALLHRAAQLVAIATWDGKRYPAIEKAFPSLFKSEEEAKATPAVPLWKKQQAGMAAWVVAYNERIKRKKEAASRGGSG